MSQSLPPLSPRKQSLLLWIIWGLLTAGLGIYAAIGCGVLSADGPGVGEISGAGKDGGGMITYAMIAASILTLLMGFLIKALLLARAIRLDAEDAANEGAMFGRYLGVMIVVWALTESIGVFGLVARFTGASTMTFLSILGLALLGMLAHRPMYRIGQ